MVKIYESPWLLLVIFHSVIYGSGDTEKINQRIRITYSRRDNIF